MVSPDFMAHILVKILRMGPVAGKHSFPIDRFESIVYRGETDPLACRIAVRDDHSGQVQYFWINLQYADILILCAKFTQHWIMSVKI